MIKVNNLSTQVSVVNRLESQAILRVRNNLIARIEESPLYTHECCS